MLVAPCSWGVLDHWVTIIIEFQLFPTAVPVEVEEMGILVAETQVMAVAAVAVVGVTGPCSHGKDLLVYAFNMIPN